MEKLVSVVMPVRNGSRFVSRAIDSILNQTYKNTELIVVEGGSDDGITLDILRSYGTKIKCFHLTELGVANSLNFGLEHASGEFIARMDADDVAVPERLQKQIEYLERHPDIDVLGTECDVIDENDEVVEVIAPGYYSDSEIKAKLIFENCISHPTIVMRRSLIDQGWRYDTSCYAEDLDLWMRMASRGIKFTNLPDHLLRYRQHDGQASSEKDVMALSTAKSAKKYVETMFFIDNGKYKTEYFARPYYSFLIQSSYTEFIKGQYLLLCEIYESNQRNRKIEEKDLVRELNARWNWLISIYCSELTRFGDFEDWLAPGNGVDSEFFILALKKRFHISDVNQMIDMLEQKFIESEKRSHEFWCESRAVVIYGVGKRGMRILKSFLEKRRQGRTSWELLAVSDKNNISFECDGQQYHTISQDELKRLNPDLVLIASALYFREIKDELIQKGMEASRLISCNWLLW